MGRFPGFPPDLILFLQELTLNNSREWFNRNKERYRTTVVAAVVEFIEAIGEPLYSISGSFIADPRPHGGSMFRIYRDTRFSKDKRPYKENIGCQFRHTAGKSAHAPGFYVHIQQDQVFIGGGIWTPPTPVLNKIRTAIVDNSNDWSKIIAEIDRLDGYSLEGERLKRAPRGYDQDHPLIDDIRRKSFFLMRQMDPAAIIQPEFLDETVQTFKATVPIMKFITSAMNLEF